MAGSIRLVPQSCMRAILSCMYKLFPNCIGLYLLNSLVPTDIVQFMTKSYLCSVAIGQAKITLLSKHQAPETGSDLHKEKGQPRVVHLKNL